MIRSRSKLAAALTALALFVIPLAASADTKSDAERLRVSRKTERMELVVQGSRIKAGGAQTFVNAPLDAVKRVVTDYGHYQDFMPKFKRSRVVAKTKNYTDVYLEVPILKGSATVWSLTRFSAPKQMADGSTVIEGTMQQGNVNDFRAKWTLIPVDDQHTLLKSEILIVPKIPVPGSLVTGELAYAADKAATASRDRSEANAVQVSSAAPTTP